MGDITIKESPSPPPPYYSTHASPTTQTVLYGPQQTVEGATLPHEIIIQPHLHTTVYQNATPYGRLPMPVKCPHCQVRFFIERLLKLRFGHDYSEGELLLNP